MEPDSVWGELVFTCWERLRFFGCRCLLVSKTNDTIFKDVKKARRHFHAQALPKATFFWEGEGGNPLKIRYVWHFFFMEMIWMLDGLFFGGETSRKNIIRPPNLRRSVHLIFPSKNWRLMAPERHFKISFCGVFFFAAPLGIASSVKYLDSADGDAFHRSPLPFGFFKLFTRWFDWSKWGLEKHLQGILSPRKAPKIRSLGLRWQGDGEVEMLVNSSQV